MIGAVGVLWVKSKRGASALDANSIDEVEALELCVLCCFTEEEVDPWMFGDTEQILVRPHGLGLPLIRRSLMVSSKDVICFLLFLAIAKVQVRSVAG